MSLSDEDKNWINGAITGAIKASENRLNTAIERVETSLLTEFHKWASPLEQRMRTHREALRTLDLELEALSERATKLEPKN